MYDRTPFCSEKLNITLREHDFNTGYFTECLPELEETLEILNELPKLNKILIRDHHQPNKHHLLNNKLKIFVLIHSSNLCALLLVEKDSSSPKS